MPELTVNVSPNNAGYVVFTTDYTWNQGMFPKDVNPPANYPYKYIMYDGIGFRGQATAKPGYMFKNWCLSGCDGSQTITGNPYHVADAATMVSKTLMANFTSITTEPPPVEPPVEPEPPVPPLPILMPWEVYPQCFIVIDTPAGIAYREIEGCIDAILNPIEPIPDPPVEPPIDPEPEPEPEPEPPVDPPTAHCFISTISM